MKANWSTVRVGAVLAAAAAVALGTLAILGGSSSSAVRARGGPALSSIGRATSAEAATPPDRLEGTSKAFTPSASLPADCVPEPSGPPGAPYQLGLVGAISKGVLTAGPATIADITAKFCGVVTLVKGKPPCGVTGGVVSPPDGQIFGSLSAVLTLVPGMQPRVPFVAHPGTITGGFSCESSSAGGLAVTLNATVSGSTGVFGLSCTIGPLTIPLTGALTGPLSSASITLKSNDFTVPTVSTSPTCPGEVPAQLDAIAGLPIKPGGASASLPATASLYQPG